MIRKRLEAPGFRELFRQAGFTDVASAIKRKTTIRSTAALRAARPYEAIFG